MKNFTGIMKTVENKTMRRNKMKKLTLLFAFTLISLFVFNESSFGQDIVVQPGVGTLSAAIASAPSGSVITLQSGTYTESAAISVSNKSLKIVGQGPNVTKITFQNSNGFIFNVVGSGYHIDVGGFAIRTNVANLYTGIKVVGPTSTNNGVVVHDIIFAGTNSSYYWNTCLQMEEAWYSIIERCWFYGIENAGTFIYLRSSVDVKIANCFGIGMNYGIRCDTKPNVTHACEGISIISSSFLLGNYLLHINGGVMFQITNSIFGFANLFGVYVNNAMNVRIENSFIEADANNAYCIYFDSGAFGYSVVNSYIGSTTGKTNINGIVCQGNGGNIVGNYIRGIQVGFSDRSMANGIWVPNGDRVTISNNTIEYTAQNGIVLGTFADRCIVSTNIAYSTNSGILNNGTNNIVANNIVY